MHKFQVIFSQKRRSIGIIVRACGIVIVRAPIGVSIERIDEIVKSKQGWITKKLEHFQQNLRELSKKEYTDGEDFLYLGMNYKLTVVDSNENFIERTSNAIFFHKTPKLNTKNALQKWFFELAFEVFSERLQMNFKIFSNKFQYQFPVLKLRKMKARWGSMASNGVITLNTQLIHTPIECIDYVIMHELCHLKYKNHGKRFHQLQGFFTPNYKEIKKKLESFSGEISRL